MAKSRGAGGRREARVPGREGGYPESWLAIPVTPETKKTDLSWMITPDGQLLSDKAVMASVGLPFTDHEFVTQVIAKREGWYKGERVIHLNLAMKRGWNSARVYKGEGRKSDLIHLRLSGDTQSSFRMANRIVDKLSSLGVNVNNMRMDVGWNIKASKNGVGVGLWQGTYLDFATSNSWGELGRG